MHQRKQERVVPMMNRRTSLFAAFVALVLSHSADCQSTTYKTPVGASQARGSSLLGCLEAAAIAEVVAGGHPKYDQARRTLSHYSSNYPTAVVYPTSTEQVQAAVKCAAKARVRLLARAGNHANQGETVQTGAVTLDLTKMDKVTLSADKNTAWVQAGAQIGKLLAEAIKQSNGTRGFPAGTRPSVGVSGFILGGGFGGYTRYAGLGADQIIGFKAVDAQGNLLDVGPNNHTGLLWASRGGGGGKFVVVTDWHLRLMDVSTGVTNFNYTIPYDKAVEAMQFYQEWAPNLPSIITHRAGLDWDDKGRRTFFVGGRYMGSIADAKKALIASGIDNSRGLLPLDKFSFKESNYLTAVVDGIGFEPPPGPDTLTMLSDRKFWDFEYDWSYKYRSLILDQALPAEALQKALAFAQNPGAEVEFQALTGKVLEVPANATAVSHLRTGKFVFIIRGTKGSSTPVEAQAKAVQVEKGNALPSAVCSTTQDVIIGSANATRFIQEMGKYVPSVKTYINFRDTDLPSWTDYLTAYHGPNVRALECVKLQYDPTNMFSMPMDVAPAPASAAGSCAQLLKEIGSVAAAYSRQLLASGPARSAPPRSVTGGQ